MAQTKVPTMLATKTGTTRTRSGDAMPSARSSWTNAGYDCGSSRARLRAAEGMGETSRKKTTPFFS